MYLQTHKSSCTTDIQSPVIRAPFKTVSISINLFFHTETRYLFASLVSSVCLSVSLRVCLKRSACGPKYEVASCISVTLLTKNVGTAVPEYFYTDIDEVYLRLSDTIPRGAECGSDSAGGASAPLTFSAVKSHHTDHMVTKNVDVSRTCFKNIIQQNRT